LFRSSDYEFNVLDSFGAQSFENFGDDYGLELFKTALDRYKAEFSVDDRVVTLRAKIGDTTDFQYRHKFNLESIEREVDALDFSTYGEGYGKNGLKVTYTRSEEHTSELQSRENLVCRLLLEKKKKQKK